MARGQAQIQCLFVNSSSEEGMQPDQYTNLYIYINIYIYLYIYMHCHSQRRGFFDLGRKNKWPIHLRKAFA